MFKYVIEKFQPFARNINVVSTKIINNQIWAIIAIKNDSDFSNITPLDEEVPKNLYKQYNSLEEAQNFLLQLQQGVFMTYDKLNSEEKVEKPFYYIAHNGQVHSEDSQYPVFVNEDAMYEIGNYYQNKETAAQNARAQVLWQCVRQFAARCDELLAPKDAENCGYTINARWVEDYLAMAPWPHSSFDSAAVIFKTEPGCRAAISMFRNELIWYFTEYDPTR